MPAVAALLDTRAALLTLRRTLTPPSLRVVACRSPRALDRACRTRLLDAMVLGPKALRHPDLAGIRRQFPGMPVIAFGAFRPDDGADLLRLVEADRVADLGVEGVDDGVLGAMVARHGLGGQRATTLADAPRLLRLTEELQRRAWSYILGRGGEALPTGEVAEALGVSREHLSRQFAAGGAPNLKRVIDLLRLVTAAQLLANPGYDAGIVAGILGFTTRSHLHAAARRIVGTTAGELARAGPRGVLLAFRRVGMRSRV